MHHARAASEGPPPVIVVFEGCETDRVQELRRLLQVELGPRFLKEPTEQTRRIHVRCDNGVASVTIDRQPTREVDLRQVKPEVADRVLTLAMVEQLNQLPLPRPDTPKTKPRTPKPATSPAPPSDHVAPPNPSSSSRLALVGALREWPTSTWTLGGAVRLTHGGRPLGLLIEGGAARGSERVGPGAVTLLTVDGRVGAVLSGHVERTEFFAVAGIRGGLGYLQGAPTSLESGMAGRSVAGGWGGPTIGVGCGLGARPGVSLELEGGYSPWAVRGQVAPENWLSIGGIWAGTNLTLGWQL